LFKETTSSPLSEYTAWWESRGQAVLVIDDSATFREELRTVLERSGYAVLIAASGEKGLHVAASQRPAAIIVAGVLPGIDGPTVIRRLRLDAALSRTPCMLLTSSDEPGAELRALDAGADAFVSKGSDLEMLLARLSVILRTSSTAAERSEAASSLGPKGIMAVDDSVTYLNELASVLRGER
jgi:two-component system NtrC family sensor kinase